MEACGFAEENMVLNPPQGLTAEECEPLPVWCGELRGEGRAYSAVVSCWKVTRAEMVEIQRTGRVWLTVMGQTMQPTYVSGESPWKRAEERVQAMRYEDIKQETPRLVVQFRRDGEREQFQWGMVGAPAMPVITLVGQLAMSQAELAKPHPQFGECPEMAHVVAWDAAAREFSTFSGGGIPRESLSGMLEIVKSLLVASHVARKQGNQQVILGPDGRPVRT